VQKNFRAVFFFCAYLVISTVSATYKLLESCWAPLQRPSEIGDFRGAQETLKNDYGAGLSNFLAT